MGYTTDDIDFGITISGKENLFCVVKIESKLSVKYLISINII